MSSPAEDAEKNKNKQVCSQQTDLIKAFKNESVFEDKMQEV